MSVLKPLLQNYIQDQMTLCILRNFLFNKYQLIWVPDMYQNYSVATSLAHSLFFCVRHPGFKIPLLSFWCFSCSGNFFFTTLILSLIYFHIYSFSSSLVSGLQIHFLLKQGPEPILHSSPNSTVKFFGLRVWILYFLCFSLPILAVMSLNWIFVLGCHVPSLLIYLLKDVVIFK